MHRRIAVLDLSHYTRGTEQQRGHFVRAWRAGLEEFGFVSIINHGVDQALIERTYRDVAALFALPRSTKDRHDIPNGGGQRGYTGFGKEHAKNRAVGDLKEFWHVGRELPEGNPRQASYGPNTWPTEVPTFRQNTSALYAALDAAASVMLRALAEAFGLPRGTFADMAHEGNSVLRLIHYPPLKDMFIPGGVRAAEHEDINLITLLPESTSTGLELLTREGEWLPVASVPGQIIVDAGDMLARVTNEVIPSTTHRVVNPRSDADDVVRYSLPFFVHPYPECPLEVLEVCTSATNPPRYPATTADAFLRQRLKEIGLVKG